MDEQVVRSGVCVDWHTPGPAGIAADGEMWTGYPQPIRPEIDVVARDSGVIHVLPITTAETGSPSIKRTKRVEDGSGGCSFRTWLYAAPSISTSASQFTGAFSGNIMPIDERACMPTSGPYNSRMRSE